MAKQVLAIHGGNAFEKYEDYLEHLRNKVLTLDKITFNGWKYHLKEELGIDYFVLTPQMPNSQNARYLEWRIYFEKLIPFLEDNIILIGHSLGGIFLAKYLSENDFPKKIKATMLVAAPFHSEKTPYVDFNLPAEMGRLMKQGGKIYLYQSKDDRDVPFADCESYTRLLPEATVRIFENRGHFAQSEFPELVGDIKSLG